MCVRARNRQSCCTCCSHEPHTVVHTHLCSPSVAVFPSLTVTIYFSVCMSIFHHPRNKIKKSPPQLLMLLSPPTLRPSSPLQTHNTSLYRMSCACHAGFPHCLFCPGNRKFTAEPRAERLNLRVQSPEETPRHTRVLLIYRWCMASLYHPIYHLETQMLVIFHFSTAAGRTRG